MRKRTWKTELPPLIGVTIGQFIALRLMEWAPAAAETDEIARVLVHFNYFYAPFILTAFFLFFAYRLLKTIVDVRGIDWWGFLRGIAGYLLIAAAIPIGAHFDQLLALLGYVSPSFGDSARTLREGGFYKTLFQNDWIRLAMDLVGVVVAFVAFRIGSTPPNEESVASDVAKSGDWGRAGDLYLKAGDVKAAKKAFKKGNLPHRLAALELRENNFAEAARLFEEAGSAHAWDAAKSYEAAGDQTNYRRLLTEAMADARSTAKWERVVEIAEATGDLEALEEGSRRLAESKAAGPGRTSLFQKAAKAAVARGNMLGAAECHRAAGDFLLAADAYRKAGKILEAAKDFERGGDLLNAARAQKEAGNEKPAYELLARDSEQKGDLDRAAEAWFRAGAFDRSAAIFERRGNIQRAGEIYLQANRMDRAAPLLHKAGDIGRAAPAYEAAGRIDMAAFLYRDLGYHEKAAALFRTVGKITEAAQCLEMVGRLEEAIPLYSRASRGLDAARCALKAGHRDQAWEHLITVPRSTPGIPQMFIQLAEAHLRSNEVSDAIHVLREFVGSTYPTRNSLVEFEALSRALEAAGEYHEAAEIMGRIAEIDPGFKNAGPRAQALGQKGQTKRLAASVPSPELVPSSQLSRAPIMPTAGPPAVQALQASQPTLHPRTPSGVFQPSRLSGRSTAFSLIADPSIRYEVLSELGRGGMGVVHKALDRKLDRYVALKILPATLWGDETAMRYFEREAKAIAAMSHPNVVALYDFGEGFGSAYLAMEYLEGPTLQSYMKSDLEKVQKNWRDYFIQAARGVAAAHAKGILHRDIKPANLMLDGHGTLRILDFGLARPEADSGLTSKLIGTPAFFPPELLRGETPSPASDVYSLGATFYTLATGRWPYTGDDILVARLERDPEDPRNFAPFLGEDEVYVLLKSMHRFRPERYQDAGQLLAALLAMDA